MQVYRLFYNYSTFRFKYLPLFGEPSASGHLMSVCETPSMDLTFQTDPIFKQTVFTLLLNPV